MRYYPRLPTDLLDMGLVLRVKRPVEVRLVRFEVSWATDRVRVIVRVHASSGEDRDVNAL